MGAYSGCMHVCMNIYMHGCMAIEWMYVCTYIVMDICVFDHGCVHVHVFSLFTINFFLMAMDGWRRRRRRRGEGKKGFLLFAFQPFCFLRPGHQQKVSFRVLGLKLPDFTDGSSRRGASVLH